MKTTPGYLWNLSIIKTLLLFNWKHGPSFSSVSFFSAPKRLSSQLPSL